ncbi:hypothetical protein [Seonamhaeicola sp.]|uniref:hypothetical protein n=1 Tax=Seonamhaeicola sp. TaxID=1912245 RepID=UPI0026348122|nr:hypothetical protein [Seonamhaeicola sp.]
MKYEILSHGSRSQLENVVRSYLRNGWLLQGGVAVAVKDGVEAYFQVVIKS